jgi:RNA polymerase sigma-70 factor (ECF subfamily)
MSDPPPTRPSLLVRIRDARDGVAWGEFVDIYGPLVYDYGRRRGLQDADAADLTQDVLRAVAATAERFAYDPARGAFRSWLFTVTRTKLLDSVRRQRPGDRGTGDTNVHKHLEAKDAGYSEDASAGEEGIEWDRAFGQRLLDWAAEQIRSEFRPTTWRAFWLCAVEGCAPREASASLGMSIGAVYAAKCRVLARLREEIARARRDGLPD